MILSLNIAEINARLRPRFADLVLQLVNMEPTTRSHSELRFGRKGSLSVVVAGPKAGAWHDHETDDRGDPVAFIAYQRRCSMREARAWALTWLGEAVHQPAPRPAPAPSGPGASQTVEMAKRLWTESAPAAGTIVEAYLRARHLVLPGGAPLRFHGACPRGAERLPAMVALMVDPITGKARGVHRTFLRPDGSGKAPDGPGGPAKMMCGNAGVIRLTPDVDDDGVVATGDLGLAEGIETSLAVAQRLGHPLVWAATSTAGIRAFPALSRFQSLTVFADADRAGIAAAEECCRRWAQRGIAARLRAPEAGDWDDATRSGGGA